MKTSQYEQAIIKLLKDNEVLFKREQTFQGLKGHKDFLRFDFVIYDRETYKILFLLEINGKQHYEEIAAWGGLRGLQKRQEYDRKKMAFALANKIPLICLPYWDINENLTYEKLINTPEYCVKTIWHNNNILKQ